jgi:long-chain acyl-CoA synthetase
LSDWNEDLISLDDAVTLDGLFRKRVARSPDREAYRGYDRASATWRSYSWRELAAEVARWQQALRDEKVRPGDRIALQLRNCPEWVIFDQACLGLGVILVPLYVEDSPENSAHILEDADVSLVLMQDAGRWKRLAPAVEGFETLRRVLLLDAGRDADELLASDERIRAVDRWLPPTGGELAERDGDPHALATIVYTSGTTGPSKGVMLSHHNMLYVAHASICCVACYREDIFLSFLPMSHTLERTAGYYLPMLAGATVVFARSVQTLGADLLEVRPTAIIAVPRIFDRVYGRIMEQMEKKSVVALWLFQTTLAVGWQRFLRQQDRGGSSLASLLWPLLNKLVASKITAKLGGNLRVAVSGGAALTPAIGKLFVSLGVPVIQGYGLTETSPVVSANPAADNVPDSVGTPLAGIDVKVGAEDELLVKTPGLMLGYWNNHAATAKVIDSEGWFHTGDQAKIENGHIFITGRLKDVLVLSNGEKVPPGDMELALLLDPLFEQVMVIGEGRSYLGALIVLNADHWPAFAQDLGLDPLNPETLKDSRLNSAVVARVKEAVKGFPGYARIRRVVPTLEPWTVENGLMTPTLKIKRPQVEAHYAQQIKTLYGN